MLQKKEADRIDISQVDDDLKEFTIQNNSK